MFAVHVLQKNCSCNDFLKIKSKILSTSHTYGFFLGDPKGT